ncbi:MAG: spore maturation protein, partial [Bacilli bacterium]
MLISVSVFRASGALEAIVEWARPLLTPLGVPPEVLPLALIRPISGAAGLGITSDLMDTYGADSLIGRMASIMQGSTDTTFYVLTVYFGAVGIKRMGDSVTVGLICDAVAIVSSVLFCYLLFV